METETLIKWQNKHHNCLELTKVHRETTDNIRVTAMPFFLGVKVSVSKSVLKLLVCACHKFTCRIFVF